MFGLRRRRHELEDGRRAGVLAWDLVGGRRVGRGHGLLLGHLVIGVGAEDGDLLALLLGRGGLGARLEQVEGLAVLLCGDGKEDENDEKGGHLRER